MRKFVDQVSFLNASVPQPLRQVFLVEGTKYFKNSVSLKNKALQQLLQVDSGEVFILPSDGTLNIRAILEKLKKDGLIYHYGEAIQFSDYPKFNYFGIFYYIDGDINNLQTAWGYCLPFDDKEIAFSKALGECIERESSYCDVKLKTNNLPRLTYGDASFLYKLIPKFTSQQIKNNKQLVATANDLNNLQGFKAPSLTGDKDRFLPTESFYWGKPSNEQQKLFFHATTSGSGGGATKKQAILSALNEVIERDHLLLYWFSGIKPKRIKNISIPGELGEYIKECEENYQLEVHFLDIRYDIDILTCACVLIDPVLNHITMGAKTGAKGLEVMKGAFLEAFAVLSSTRGRKKGFSEEKLNEAVNGQPFTQNILRSDRINLYASAAGIKIIRDNFLGGDEESYLDFLGDFEKINRPETEIDEHLIAEFKRLVKTKGPGYHIYMHEFSSKWLSVTNYHAVHVFIPTFLKLHLNEALATPVSDRLSEFAKLKGKCLNDETSLNQLPHFFP